MYNNRLNNCGCSKSTTTANTTTVVNTTTSVVKPETTISNVVCGTQKVLSITKLQDKVVIMFDDCSYITAPLSVVDSNFCSELTETLTAQLANYVRKDELVLVQNLEGTKDLFKAFPVTTEETTNDTNNN